MLTGWSRLGANRRYLQPSNPVLPKLFSVTDRQELTFSVTDQQKFFPLQEDRSQIYSLFLCFVFDHLNSSNIYFNAFLGNCMTLLPFKCYPISLLVMTLKTNIVISWFRDNFTSFLTHLADRQLRARGPATEGLRTGTGPRTTTVGSTDLISVCELNLGVKTNGANISNLHFCYVFRNWRQFYCLLGLGPYQAVHTTSVSYIQWLWYYISICWQLNSEQISWSYRSLQRVHSIASRHFWYLLTKLESFTICSVNSAHRKLFV